MRIRLIGTFVVIASAACSLGEQLPAEDRTATTIPPAGGQAAHSSRAAVVVPAQAVTQPTEFSIETTSTPLAEQLGALPVGPALLLGPAGRTFDRAVTVVVPFDATRVPAGAQARLVVMTAPRGSSAWQPLDSVVDPATSTVRASVMHFSVFVAALPPARTEDRLDAAPARPAPPSDASVPRDLPPASTSLGIAPREVVTRLARFLWKDMPDQALLAQAAGGKPATADDVRQLAAEMLNDARARDLPADFVAWWLGLDRLASVNLDARLFPRWNAALRASMLMETRLFASHVAFDGDGRLATLLTAPFSFIDANLGSLYGVAPAAGGGFQRTELPATQRAGILTHAAALAVTSHPNATSPTRRGMLVHDRLLCQAIPPHPPSVDMTPPEPRPPASRREQYLALVTEPACAACHRLVDRVGFGLEHYDASGAYRTAENGKPIDASGELANVPGADGPFVGAPELARKLAGSAQVQRCFAMRWLHHALGRAPGDAEARSVDQIAAAAAAAGWVFRATIVEVAATPAFLRP